MSDDVAVLHVIDRLESLGVDHMIVGSYASNLYGVARSSFDADIVVRVKPDGVESFVAAFAEGYSVDPDALRRDLQAGTMFNLLPETLLFKVDLIPVRGTPFAQEEFRRRRRVTAFGRAVWVASPEDVILSKLHRHRKGGGASSRQVEDARNVYAVQGGSLDEAYLDPWAADLGVRDLLDQIRATA